MRVHDFPGDAVGKAIPYGVYDMARNEDRVVGRSRHSGFRRRVDPSMVDDDGTAGVPGADALYITADAGSRNAYRTRAGKPPCNA